MTYPSNSSPLWMNLRTALDAGISLPFVPSYVMTGSSNSHPQYWVGAQTQLPLYKRRTPAKTAGSKDTGHPNVLAGHAPIVPKSCQDTSKKTVCFAQVTIMKSDLSLSMLIQLWQAICLYAQTATYYSLEPIKGQ